MPFESALGARLLLSATVGYARGKYQRMAFMDDAVEHAAMRVADQHEGLEPGVFPAAFEKKEVKTLIDDFDAGGDPITVERVAETLNEELLDPDLDIDSENLVAEFFEYLEQEISQNPEIGNKLQTIYAQRLYEYATRLRDGQEELLERIEVVGKDRSSKGYEVFQTVDDRFETQLAGEHPRQRFDLPFYGRTDEITEFSDFVESDEDVLVVHGPAGIGKTRLVVQASFQLQARHPEWTVYTANVHADLDSGLEEIEFDEEEEGIILFIDDARDADQLDRVFDIAEQRRSQVKLVFTERSIFAPSLEDRAIRFSLDARMLPLSPLDSETVTSLIEDSYGIRDPQTLDWIITVSEGKPLIAHLLAEQMVSDGFSGQDPVGAEDSVIENLFDDVVRDVQRAAEQQGLSDPQKLESYFRYVAAVGTLDTDDDEFMTAFRDALSLDREEEHRYREVLLEAVGTVNQSRDILQVQPDALREYIVYDTFFGDSVRDYMDTVYDVFGDFTEKTQLNNLLVIENRYESREAGAAIDTIVSGHIDQMEEYTIPDRVRLLRRFDMLGAASPTRGLELVEVALTTEPPAEEVESEGLRRRILKAPSDVGNLYLEAISLLSPGLLKEPEPVIDALVEIALVDEVSPGVAEKVFQQLRQRLRPSYSNLPVAQTQVVERVSDYLLDSELDTAFRMELLDTVGVVSSETAEDFSIDPVNKFKGRIRRGPIRQSEATQDFRLTVVDTLIDVIEECDDHALKVKAAGKLPEFVLAQRRYYGAHDEVFNRDELEHIYEFAIEHVSGEEDLDCLSKLHQLVDKAEDSQLGIEELGSQLEQELLDHDQYQLLLHMDPRGWEWDENEEKIREFVRDLDSDWERQFDTFVDVVERSSETSFDRFFKLLGEERPEAGIQLLEDTPAALEDYRERVVVGICAGSPETGQELVSDYIDAGTYGLACAGLRVLINTNRDYAVSEFERIESDADRFTEQLVLHLSSVLRGQWDEDREWTQETFLNLLHESESVTPRILDGLFDALPTRTEELATVDDAVFNEVLDYAVEFEQLGTPHQLQLIVAEVAEQRPLDFVEFCIDRVHHSPNQVELLPLHMDVDVERMQNSDQYDSAVRRIANIVIDTDEHSPTTYARLFHTIPVGDVASLLDDRVPNCSEDQLFRIIWYCQLFTPTDSVENLLLAVMIDGVEDIRDAEAIQRNILSAISSSPLGTVTGPVNDRRQRELAAVRDWQADSSLPVDVRNFAREAEQYLLDDLDQLERFEEDIF